MTSEKTTEAASSSDVSGDQRSDEAVSAQLVEGSEERPDLGGQHPEASAAAAEPGGREGNKKHEPLGGGLLANLDLSLSEFKLSDSPKKKKITKVKRCVDSWHRYQLPVLKNIHQFRYRSYLPVIF